MPAGEKDVTEGVPDTARQPEVEQEKLSEKVAAPTEAAPEPQTQPEQPKPEVAPPPPAVPEPTVAAPAVPTLTVTPPAPAAAVPAAAQTTRSPQGASDEDGPAPPLPPRRQPLPPPHPAAYAAQPGAPPQWAHGDLKGYSSPAVTSSAWRLVKQILYCCSLICCAIYFGIALYMGTKTPYNSGWPFLDAWGLHFGLGATTCALAAAAITVEFLATAASRNRTGLHPGAHVAFHLIIWLVGFFAVVAAFLHLYDIADYELEYLDSIRPGSRRVSRPIPAISTGFYSLQAAVISFLIILWVIHFTLFVRACVETARLNKERRRPRVVYVQAPNMVPFTPGAGMAGVGGYPVVMPYPGNGYSQSPYVMYPPQPMTGQYQYQQQYQYPMLSPALPPPHHQHAAGAQQQPQMVSVPVQGPAGAVYGFYSPAVPGRSTSMAGTHRQSQLPVEYFAPEAPAPAQTHDSLAVPSRSSARNKVSATTMTEASGSGSSRTWRRGMGREQPAAEAETEAQKGKAVEEKTEGQGQGGDKPEPPSKDAVASAA